MKLLSTSVIVENTSISRISNTDIDNTEEPGSYDLRDIAKCSTIPCGNIPPSAPTGDEQINNIHVSRDVPKSRQLVLPYSLNIHIHHFGIVNPKNHCYLNSVIQLLLPILRTISYDFQFNSSTEGTLSKYMLETAYNAYSSTDVDVLKFQLVQYNQFYDGKNQQDSSECLLMLIEIINKGSVPYYGSHVSNSTGVSLSDILFSFMLEKYIVCNVCGLRSPSIESSGVLYISPTHTSSMQELIMQGLQQKLEKSCFRCKKAICNTTTMIRHAMSQVAEKNMAANGPTSAQQDRRRPSIGPKNQPPGTCHIKHKKSIQKHPCDFYITIYKSNINPNWFNIKTTSSLYQNSRQMAWQPYDTGQESSYLMYW